MKAEHSNAIVSRLLAGCLSLILLQSLANANQIVFEQVPSPVWNAYNSVQGQNAWNVFDDFSLTANTNISGISWGGAYYDPDDKKGDLQGFFIGIWSDLANKPNGILYSANITGVANETIVQSLPYGQFFEYSTILPSAASLIGGQKYWLSIQAILGASTPTWGWLAGVGGDSHSWQYSTSTTLELQQNSDMAFQLTASTVPEPATLLLFSAGLAVLACIRVQEKFNHETGS